VFKTAYCSLFTFPLQTVFKDGGKEEKKKDVSTKGVKCYFIRTDSTASIDMQNPYIFAGKSMHEARMHFMHVNTLSSLPNYMSRYSIVGI